MWWRSWLRHCATSRKIAGLIPNDVIGIFHWHISGSHSAYQKYFLGVKGGRCVGLTTLPPVTLFVTEVKNLWVFTAILFIGLYGMLLMHKASFTAKTTSFGWHYTVLIVWAELDVISGPNCAVYRAVIIMIGLIIWSMLTK